MIATITALALTIIAIIILSFDIDNDFVNPLAFLVGVCGGVVTIVMIIIIITEHVGVEAAIEENRIAYESLCERNEVISSEYEDVSKSDVIKDIAEWNKSVYSYKYWTYNPWTNWFHSKRIADELQMIERR